jgi:hypothetical protein
MKKILVFCLFSISALAQDVAKLRKEFIAATSNQEASQVFLTSTAKLGEKPLLQAYKGAALIIHAKYVKGIESKKKYAKDGITTLESAVQKDPQNVEIRTLRLSIQEQSPKILKYKSNIEEDRSFVKKALADLPEGALKTFVEGYIEGK